MGLFDEFIGPLLEPLKEVSETLQQVKDDAISTVTQIGEEVEGFKDQGQAAISDLTETIKGDSAGN